MNPGAQAREAIRSARTVVVKVGTAALTDETGTFSADRMEYLVEVIEGRMKAGSDVVIVPPGRSRRAWFRSD
ncbi:Probable glutamate 5-kinase (ProB) [Mycobacteroides abscessus]|nr:Probable glutamate 5-kinase (ProB) [Mycobacteroides abscessus]